jgi:hypothetical protein
MLRINPALPHKPRVSVLVIYTGGTLGMAYDRGSKRCWTGCRKFIGLILRLI